MGTEGRKTSLVRREGARRLDRSSGRGQFDAVIALSGCDKTDLRAGVLALARIGHPS